ncbi:MAG: hypothetical protein KJ667_09350 [Alphaproteobacteria bacterium]|nr:hypothetical protein [Alphaproteobacteria bacterium]
MSERQSDKVWEKWVSENNKFDYFMITITGVLCAYLNQNYTAEKISLSPNTLELASLSCLLISVVCGIKKIEKTIKVLNYNFRLLTIQEDAGKAVKIPQAEKDISEGTAATFKMAKFRDFFLFLGFALLILANVWAAYH